MLMSMTVPRDGQVSVILVVKSGEISVAIIKDSLIVMNQV